MAGFYQLDHKEVIRIKVKKCNGRMQPEYKKFSIDPQITSFEMLQGILARAFDINSDFTISYLARDSEGQTVYLSMLSDWDMDAAFQCAADPCLKLKVDLRPFEDEIEDWDVVAPAEIPHHRISSLLDKGSFLGSLTGTITHNLGKTVNTMQRAMGFKQSENEAVKPLKPPMSDMEFHNYLDSGGFMIKPNEFRLSIYQGGIEPSLRRVAWRHLLNIYPADMSGKDRFDYMKRKEEEYRKLRDEWRERFRNNTATEEVKYVASMVKKDVLRTDRSHGFYAGNDENENTLSLFHILVTYALTHPDVSYCQGMSDLASPLLVTQKEEGQAYVCFCALMNRLRQNFTTEGNAIMIKFQHLSNLLYLYDPVLHTYLAQNSASDMFFCYRWFLLEFKREFPFSDALYVLEVLWATLPPNPPERELSLVDPDYSSRLLSSSPCSPTVSFQHAMYAKLLAIRCVGARQRGAQATQASTATAVAASCDKNINCNSSTGENQLNFASSRVKSFDTSPGDVEDRTTDFPEVDNPMTRSLQQKSNSIDLVLHDGTLPGENGEKNISLKTDVPDNNASDESARVQISACANREACTTADSENLTCHNNTVSVSNKLKVDINGFCMHFSSIKKEESSDVSSDDSDSEDNQQIEFTLSLDSNMNNSVEAASAVNKPHSLLGSETTFSTEYSNFPINIETVTSTLDTKAETDNIEDVSTLIDHEEHTCSTEQLDSNPTLFQSMKRFLASPKRRPFSSSVQESNTSPISSPKKLLTNRHHSASAIIPQDSDKTEVVRNLSDSHIPDSREQSETFDHFGNTFGLISKLPIRDLSKLPPPQEFGAGNPFLMFMSLTLLTQHREIILSQNMCYEEIAMHFDRLVRQHNAQRVLHLARQMYSEYLRAQQSVCSERDKDNGGVRPSC